MPVDGNALKNGARFCDSALSHPTATGISSRIYSRDFSKNGFLDKHMHSDAPPHRDLPFHVSTFSS